MAKTHHKPEVATPTTRYYTVGYVSDAKYQPIPSVTLKGHWLEEAGFGTGTPVNVRVMQDCLIITRQEPQPEPPAEPEVVTTLKRACKKLSARKQREIAAFIELVATPQKRPRKIPDGAVEWRPI
ncbi:SymE family type I addiction module toxin [Kalamiella sp. sgz302252]|uniref:SymE family type I addiction module toxin n=1 Tax=Pantoea sp. sgz302252 TaxID=3341827 RepID=UPI0036D2A8DB